MNTWTGGFKSGWMKQELRETPAASPSTLTEANKTKTNKKKGRVKEIMNENEKSKMDEMFTSNCHKAEKMLEDPGKIDKLLKRLEKKLRKIPSLKKLGASLTYVPKMGMLLNSWIRGDYTDVPIGSIVAIISALAYFILPVDVIMDIPPIGYIDDAALIAGALYLFKSDLDEYMKWRVQMGLDEVELEDDEYEFTVCTE